MLVLNFLISLYQVNKINQQWDVRVCPAPYFNTETTRFYYKYYWECTPKLQCEFISIGTDPVEIHHLH